MNQKNTGFYPPCWGLFKSLSHTWYGMFRCKARKKQNRETYTEIRWAVWFEAQHSSFNFTLTFIIRLTRYSHSHLRENSLAVEPGDLKPVIYVWLIYAKPKWSHRLVVRTLASHAGNRGSTPRGTTRNWLILMDYLITESCVPRQVGELRVLLSFNISWFHRLLHLLHHLDSYQELLRH